MRLIIGILVAVNMVFAATTLHADEALARCLEKRLNAVLAGEDITKHAVVKSMVKLALGPGNFATIKDDKEAIKRFEAVIIDIMSARIAEKGRNYVGSRVEIDEPKPKKNGTTGYLITPTGGYWFSVSFNSREECLIYDLNVEGMFRLYEWIGNKPDFQALMKEYRMKR